MTETCKNCGWWYGFHETGTEACPSCWQEGEPDMYMQRRAGTVFEPEQEGAEDES